MQINQSANSTNFGALYLHKGCRMGKVYKYNSEIINFVKGDLQKLANDIDVHIRYRNILENGFDITVGKVVNSPLKRLLGIVGQTAFRAVRAENCYNNSIVETLTNNILGAAEDYYKIIGRKIL